MITEKSRKFSTVNLMTYGQEEDLDLHGGKVDKHEGRKEELVTGGKHIGIRLNGRRPLRRRRSTGSVGSTKKKERRRRRRRRRGRKKTERRRRKKKKKKKKEEEERRRRKKKKAPRLP